MILIKRGVILAILLSFFAMGMGIVSAAYINPANGHYYDRISVPNIDWHTAKTSASMMTLDSTQCHGYLATITSQSENDFIVNTFGATSLKYYWIGGYQPSGSPEPAGNWQWVTGEPWSYTNWNTGEPNNLAYDYGPYGYFSHEDALGLWSNGAWNDAPSTITMYQGYIVEFERHPPIAIIVGPSSGYEGSELLFDASGSSDPEGSITEYAWDFGDGSIAGEVSGTHVFQDNGAYTVSLTVTNDEGMTDTGLFTVTILNSAPVVNAGDDQDVMEGDEVTFSGSFTDAGSADTHIITWDFGEGAGPMLSPFLNPKKTYVDDGVYTVTLTVADDDGASSSDTITVTVNEKDTGGGGIPVHEFPSTVLPLIMIVGFLGAVLLIQKTKEH